MISDLYSDPGTKRVAFKYWSLFGIYIFINYSWYVGWIYLLRIYIFINYSRYVRWIYLLRIYIFINYSRYVGWIYLLRIEDMSVCFLI